MDNSQSPWDCDAARQALPLYVGGDLPATAMEALARHLRACRACSALESRAVRARGVLVLGLQAHAAEPAPDLLVGLRAKLQAPADASGTTATPGARHPKDASSDRGRLLAFPYPLRRIAFVGAAAAALLASLSLYLGDDDAREAGNPVVVEASPDAAPVEFTPAAPSGALASDPTLVAGAPSPRQPAPVSLLGVASDDDALRPLRVSEVPLRHAAVRTVEVPWIEGNPGRVLTPGGSVSAAGFGGLPR
jgi:hypothetical protein